MIACICLHTQNHFSTLCMFCSHTLCLYSNLSEVKLQDVADVMWWALGQLHQLFAVLKGLAQLLHTSLHPVHSVDALQAWRRQFLNTSERSNHPELTFTQYKKHPLTFIFSARLSISEMHLVMMKGMPSLAQLATWENSLPNSCRRPCSFLWPHWMARVSRQRLWQARKHWETEGEKKVLTSLGLV